MRDDVQATVNSLSPFWDSRNNEAGNLHGYNNASAPSYLPNLRPDVINYYDDYAIPGLPNNESASYSDMTKGLLTAQKVRVLGTDDFLWTINYYDQEGRVVNTYKQHYLSGNINAANYDVITNSYSFVGELISSTRLHHANGATTTITDRYEYDHVGRPIATFQKINEQAEVVLAHQIYNELGQLKEKKLHNDLQSTSLAYNERGWMTRSSSNEFSMELRYNENITGEADAQYNGNIANQLWGQGNNLPYSFGYRYDKLNRLKKGITAGLNNLMSEQMEYDVMGNFKWLSRDGGNANHYDYPHGNQLWYVAYVTNGYAYDANGNTTTDGRSGYSIQYNHLNLPRFIPDVKLTYTYDATGRKLSKNSNGSFRNYIDGIEYKPDGSIDFIQTAEGLAQNNGGAYTYHYNLSDHLGNVRYSFEVSNRSIGKLEQTDYYPFGMRRNTFASGANNKYLYNGKEMQDELGAPGQEGHYDYGARFYDPVIGRFNTIDRFAEKYDNLTPYQYAGNNPVLNIDVNGDSIKVNTSVSVNLSSIGLGNINIATSVYFQGGSAYYQNGTAYNGNDDFVFQVGGALSELSNGSTGKDLVNTLEVSSNTATIVKRNDNSSGENYILWNPISTGSAPQEGSSTSRPAFIGLGHEMAHVKDVWKGTVDRGKWYDTTDGSGNIGKPVTNSEKYATHIENKLRAEHNLPLRTHYSPDGNGGAYEPSRLIRSYRRQGTFSRFYFQANPLTIISSYRYR